MKKILELIRKFDHVWGLPLAIFLLIGGNTLSNHYFNDPLISTEYLSPLFMTACVLTFIHAISFLGMWLNHKDLFKHYNDDASFKYLNDKERILLYLGMYLVYLIVAIIVYFYINNLFFT